MKKRKNLLGLLSLALLIFSCQLSQNKSESYNDTTIQSFENPSTAAYDYNDIVQNQDKYVGDFGWTRKHELDLNDDGINEEFLAVSGYSRGMDYVLFTKKGKDWLLLSSEETIPSSDAGISKLEAKNGEWHDFVASQGSGRGGIIESLFSWDGHKFVLKQQKEVEM